MNLPAKRKGGSKIRSLKFVLIGINLIVCLSLRPVCAQTRDETQRLLDEQQQTKHENALTHTPSAVGGAPLVSQTSDDNADPALLNETEAAFVIKQIDLNFEVAGNAKSSPENPLDRQTIDSIIKPFLGLKIGAKRLNLLLRHITNAYIAHGYITTRAYIAEQNLAQGKLVVTVIGGEIAAIRLNHAPFPGANALAGEGAGALLKLADVEQTVDQINRLRSSRAQAQLLPGQTAGASIIEITNPPSAPWRASVGWDNSGQPATGKNRQKAGFEADNVLGLWEAWSIQYVASSATSAWISSATVPWGYALYSYTHATSQYTQPIGALARASGASTSDALGVNQVLVRDASSRTAFDATLIVREALRKINTVSLMPQHQSSARVALSRTQRSASLGVVSGEMGLTYGLNALGADVDLPGLPDTAAHNQFTKQDVNLGVILPLNADLALRSNFNGQLARAGLVSAEQIFIGGMNTVRGFDDGVVGGDRGYYLRNEMQWTNALPRQMIDSGLQWSPYLFVDSGRTRLLADATGYRLSSLGLGARLAWKYANAEVVWAHPTVAPVFVEKSNRFHLSLTLTF